MGAVASSDDANLSASSEMPVATLIYVHDPMCSWCWGFSPTWHEIRETLQHRYPSDRLVFRYVAGGLAPDSTVPMSSEVVENISGTWKTIEQKLGTRFNHDFWKLNTPRRSSYPACRAVITARERGGAAKESAMIGAIQQAYYLKAQNPSNLATLVDCASRIGLDKHRFERMVQSPECDALLQYEIGFSRQLFSEAGGRGFPSLFLEVDGQYQEVPFSYTEASVTVGFLAEALGKNQAS